jgi:trimethylguanosine synthase
MSGDEEPPPEVHHYENRGQVPWDIQKYEYRPTGFGRNQLTPLYSYWSQRYDLFSKWDDGIWLTDDAWFGVTPEPVATYVISAQVIRVLH